MLQTTPLLCRQIRLIGRFYCVAALSPPGAPSDQGESKEDALRFGAAVRIASTPASSVIAVAASGPTPSVATIITASPFCTSASVLLGKRPNMRCKSGGPLPPDARPCGAAPLFGGASWTVAAFRPLLPSWLWPLA